MALESEGSIRDFFEASGGIEALGKLEMHPNSEISGQVSEMMQLFFGLNNGGSDAGFIHDSDVFFS
jgi:hypothetical protein